jgi:uncharacterized membrane protein
MKVFGHPLHIMLIHFPSALLPMDFVCSILGFYTGNISFASASFYAMLGGVAMGALAIIAGVADLITVVKHKPTAVNKILIHGGINTVVIIAYSVLAYIAYKRYPQLTADSLSTIILKGCIITFMIVGNFIGGSLILKHKIGIEK